MIMIMMVTLTGSSQVFFFFGFFFNNLLTAQLCISDTHAHVAKEQSCAYDIWEPDIVTVLVYQEQSDPVSPVSLSRVTSSSGGVQVEQFISTLWCDRLVGLVVEASTSRAEDPGFESRLPRDFSGVYSYQ